MANTCVKFVHPNTQAIHPEWLQTGVPTGRFRCKNPNLQAIPPELRSAFVARPGHWFLAADYDQIELRILAACAGEAVLLDAFKAGQDPHAATASLMLGVPLAKVTSEQRAIGKTLNYATLYGTGVRGLSHRLGVPQEKAQELLKGYFAAVPQLTRFLQKLRGGRGPRICPIPMGPSPSTSRDPQQQPEDSGVRSEIGSEWVLTEHVGRHYQACHDPAGRRPA